jgi:hypothetical protein
VLFLNISTTDEKAGTPFLFAYKTTLRFLTYVGSSAWTANRVIYFNSTLQGCIERELRTSMGPPF